MLGLSRLREKATEVIWGAQETLYKVILVMLTVTTLLWMSIFLYASFYYSYIPPVSHTRPVHLQFERSCDRYSRQMCNFPSANVTLTRREQFLMVGQPYKIILELEMPESPANQNAGMFMVCARLESKNREHAEESCRSAMLQYRSTFLHLISTVVLYPFLFSGSYEEKQLLSVELFSNFQEDVNNPVTDAFIELQSFGVEVYRTTLKIHAHFTGLRYLMFHWPLTSAILGICTNLFFLSVIAFLSWYKFFNPNQVTVHVGYDASTAKSLEERYALAKERIKHKILIPVTEIEEEVPHADKEDLDFSNFDMNGEDEATILETSTELFDYDDEDHVVPDLHKSVNSSSEESGEENVKKSSRSSSEFEVLLDRRNDENEDKGQGDVRFRRHDK